MAEFLEVGKDARAEQVHMDEKGHHTTESSSNVGGSDVSELIHDPKDWVNLRFCWQFFNVSLIWMLYGYDVQFVGSLLGLPYFVSRFQGPNSAGLLVFNARNLNLLLPVSVCGTALAPFVTPFVVDKMGRKKTLLFAFGFCCVPSSFLQLFAPNISALAVGRLWNYFGISMAEQVAAPFTAEIVPAKYRSTFLGASVGINQLTGIAATAIMYGCSHLVGDKQWKIPLAIQAGLPAILFIVTLTSLESPTWLISKGRIDEATTVQSKLRPAHRKDLVRAEIANLVAAYEEDKNMKKGNFWELFSKRHLKRTITSALASACTACSGYSLTATYGVTILIASGVSDPFKWQIGTATLAFAGQMVGSYAYDRVGRRLMIVGGYISILVLDFLCGGIATTGLKTTSQGKALASFSIILSFFANVTFAAIYVLQTEIPTLSLRSYTIAYSTFWNAVATIISYFVSPYLLTAPANLGAKTYLIFGGFMVIATIAAYLLIPETSNRTWVEIDELYDKKVPAWKWKGYQCESVQAVSATAQKMEQQGH